MTKRIFDIAVAGVLLVAAAPLMLLIACYILVVSGRPVIFRQSRVGMHQRPFVVLKFRSMYVGSETHRRVLSTDDDRFIPGASVIRSLHFDELPQLINVLRGEMSMVGPRPVTREIFAENIAIVPRYAERFDVRPGLTGLAQLWGRHKIMRKPPHVRLRLERYYIRNQCIVMDAVVLAKTVSVVLRRKGC